MTSSFSKLQGLLFCAQLVLAGCQGVSGPGWPVSDGVYAISPIAQVGGLGLPAPAYDPHLGGFSSGEAIPIKGAQLVSARNGELLLYDPYTRQVVLVDPVFQSARAIRANLGLLKALYLARDGSIYVADSVRGQVIQLDRDGRELASFYPGSMPFEPSDILVDDVAGLVLVLDATHGRIVTFALTGAWIGTEDLPSDFPVDSAGAGLTAMTTRGVYALDRLGRKVVFYNADASFGGAISLDGFLQPSAMAVDNCGRIFVADLAMGALYLVSAGGSGQQFALSGSDFPATGKLTDMTIDGSTVYLAREMEGVTAWQIEPGCGK